MAFDPKKIAKSVTMLEVAQVYVDMLRLSATVEQVLQACATKAGIDLSEEMKSVREAARVAEEHFNEFTGWGSE